MSRRSSFESRRYEGYEIHLKLQRSKRFEPYAVSRSRDIHRFVQELRHELSEYMGEVVFDNKHRICGVYLVGKGSRRECSADPKEI